MDLLAGAEVLHTSKASQLSNHALTAVDANVFRLQNICSSCALQAGFADKISAWAPAQAAPLGVWRPGFNPVQGTASPEPRGMAVCGDGGGGWTHGQPGRVGPAGQDTRTCWLLSLPSFVPAAPWEWRNLVGHSRKVRGARSAGEDRLRILLCSGRARSCGALRWRSRRMESREEQQHLPCPQGLLVTG